MAAVATPSYASASLYVGDLFNDVTEALLFEIFNAVGPVASVRVCRDAATRRSLGYAYVNYHRMEDAERALDTMNFKNIRNKPCRIMWSHRDPSLRKSGLGNIFVKNLASSIDNKSLYDTFSMFGNILSCKVSTTKEGESLGYGFVHYETEESATAAIQRVNGKVIADKQVIVEIFRSKKERAPSSTEGELEYTNVYAKNIAEEATEEQVNELFASHGQITSMALKKGYAFVNFANAEEAAAAVKALNGLEWTGKELFVGRAQRKEEREKELREKFESLKLERQKKFEGVNLYVKNLADGMTEEKLQEQFVEFGAITSLKIMMDSAGKSKGFGFVCYATPEEAAKAVAALNGRLLDGKPLFVAIAQRKKDRRQQLEIQHGQRKGVPNGMHPQGMYPPQGPPVFYAPGVGVPPRNFVYPGQMGMMQRRFPGQPGGPMMQQRGPGGPQGQQQYQLMPVPGRQGPGPQGPRGGRGRRNQGPQGQQRGQQQRQQGPPGQQQGPQGQGPQGPQQQQQMPPQQQQPQAPTGEPQALTIKDLAAAPEAQQKQMIGERLFPLVQAKEGDRAGKITGMLLEMDNGELLHLIESTEARNEKVAEAVAVLETAVEA